MYSVLIGTLLSAFIISVNSINQLSFSGGGAFGAVEVGILKKIREDGPIQYDRYTGISAGGLNSGFLAHFTDIDEGIRELEEVYSNIQNRDVYELLPDTGISVLNTAPLYDTLTNIITDLNSYPVIETFIGTVNLNTGNLDIYKFNNHSIEDRVLLLMSTSAIPIMFPPIKYNGYMYTDGGTLSNELLDIIHSSDYLNITYLSSFGPMKENDNDINNIKNMVTRTFQIVKQNFNNPFSSLNHDCNKPYGEITYYYVDNTELNGYTMLNFDKGEELIQVGYNNIKYTKYSLC